MYMYVLLTSNLMMVLMITAQRLRLVLFQKVLRCCLLALGTDCDIFGEGEGGREGGSCSVNFEPASYMYVMIALAGWTDYMYVYDRDIWYLLYI